MPEFKPVGSCDYSPDIEAQSLPTWQTMGWVNYTMNSRRAGSTILWTVDGLGQLYYEQ